MEFIDWQPGNGTRYPIAFWQEEKDGHLRWVITWLRNEVSGPSFKWSGDLFDLGYMAGKMDINIYDAQGLAYLPLIQEALKLGFTIGKSGELS